MAEIIDFQKIIKSKIAKKGMEITVLNNTNGDDFFGYDKILSKAMKSAIREIICQIANDGLPENHHLYIKFKTKNNEFLDKEIQEKYPEIMVINLQHKFNKLKVSNDTLSIWLNFSGKNKRIVIPFDSIISIVDPAIPFGISIDS